MTDLVTTSESRELDYVTGKDGKDIENFVTFIIEDQMLGIPVLGVQDILTPDRIASVPLAPPEVKGSIPSGASSSTVSIGWTTASCSSSTWGVCST